MQIDLWKSISASLASVLLTGAAAWLSFGANRVSRDEMEKYVETSGPYVKDRRTLLESIQRANARDEQQSIQIQSLLIEQAKLAVKIDQLLAEVGAFRLHQKMKDQ